jgi:hypothetical protein
MAAVTSIGIPARKVCELVPSFTCVRLAAERPDFSFSCRGAVGFGWFAMPVRRDKIDECIEALCRQGCSKVYRHIDALQRSEEFPDVAGLSEAERLLVLAELVAIMDIYDGSCES